MNKPQKATKRTKNKTQKRPLGAWLISGYYFFSGIWTTVGFLFFQNMSPENQSILGVSKLDFMMGAIVSLIGLGGAIFLFKMKKMAINIFSVLLGVSILVAMIQFKTLEESTRLISLGGMALGIAIKIAVILYCKSLDKKGMLSA